MQSAYDKFPNTSSDIRVMKKEDVAEMMRFYNDDFEIVSDSSTQQMHQKIEMWIRS